MVNKVKSDNTEAFVNIGMLPCYLLSDDIFVRLVRSAMDRNAEIFVSGEWINIKNLYIEGGPICK